MIFMGRVVTPEDMGNITYGYLGSALGFSEETLYKGSFGNHIIKHGLGKMENEKKDREMVRLGIAWYRGENIGVSISEKTS